MKLSPKNPPSKIYLQFYGCDKAELKTIDCGPAEEISWCVDKIYDTDIEYVRAQPKHDWRRTSQTVQAEADYSRGKQATGTEADLLRYALMQGRRNP